MHSSRRVGALAPHLLLAALASATSLPVLARHTGGVVQLRHIELQSDATSAALTLSLSGPVEDHLLYVHNPERLVIDLPATHRVAALPVPPAGGVVTAVRSGQNVPRQLRLVLDLTAPIRVQRRASQGSDWQLHVTFQATGALQTAGAGPAQATAAVAVPAVSPAATAIRVAHAPSAESHPVIVAVDAGHGGDDPGASGHAGTHEKDITLSIARALAMRINREPGMRAVLTRDGDYFVDLAERRVRAQNAHADMFVSVHADAIRDREISGASVYVLSERGASSQAAKILAEKENAADLRGGISLAEQRPELRPVLLDLQQNASMAGSSEAADRVLNALDGVGAVRKREVQRAAFVVLKSPYIPSMLIETAYISNPAEERMLRTPSYQQRLAEAIFNGIEGYFRKYPPEGSLFAREREHERAPVAQSADAVPLAATLPASRPELVAQKSF